MNPRATIAALLTLAALPAQADTPAHVPWKGNGMSFEFIVKACDPAGQYLETALMLGTTSEDFDDTIRRIHGVPPRAAGQRATEYYTSLSQRDRDDLRDTFSDAAKVHLENNRDALLTGLTPGTTARSRKVSDALPRLESNLIAIGQDFARQHNWPRSSAAILDAVVTAQSPHCSKNPFFSVRKMR